MALTALKSQPTKDEKEMSTEPLVVGRELLDEQAPLKRSYTVKKNALAFGASPEIRKKVAVELRETPLRPDEASVSFGVPFSPSNWMLKVAVDGATTVHCPAKPGRTVEETVEAKIPAKGVVGTLTSRDRPHPRRPVQLAKLVWFPATIVDWFTETLVVNT